MQKNGAKVKRLRDSHAEATRQALVAAATSRFVAHGYAATSLDDIAQDIGTTKGAVYHHFSDKKAVFRAVYEGLSFALIDAVARSEETIGAQADGALRAFVRHAGEARYQRVLFKEGPAVLGAAVCREIDNQYSLGLITQLIGHYAPPDLIAAVGVDILARMLLSALVEAAQIIASSDPAAAADVADKVQLVLRKLVLALTQP